MQPNEVQKMQYVIADEYNKLAAVVNDLTAKLNGIMAQNAQRGNDNAEPTV